MQNKKESELLAERLFPEVFSKTLQQLFVLEATIKSIFKTEREKRVIKRSSMAQRGSWTSGCSETQGKEREKPRKEDLGLQKGRQRHNFNQRQRDTQRERHSLR